MPTIRDEAAVLRKLDYSEMSQVVVLFTRDHGKVRAIAKGIKRSTKRRFAPGIDLLDVGTPGQTELYADDPFSWDFLAGSEGSISFDGLNVVAIDGYWVHPDTQSAGATLTANFSGGGSETSASAPVAARGALGQSAGFFETVSAPDGETITGLTFSFGDGGAAGDLAALDVLELTVISDP